MLPQAHGYATKEFEVTPERLGVYLPVRYTFTLDAATLLV